jgi:hypothetical protein
MSRESIAFPSRNVEFSPTMRWSCWSPIPNHALGKSKGVSASARGPSLEVYLIDPERPTVAANRAA